MTDRLKITFQGDYATREFTGEAATNHKINNGSLLVTDADGVIHMFPLANIREIEAEIATVDIFEADNFNELYYGK